MIGAGYMGKAHTIGYKSVGSVFSLECQPVCEMICTQSLESAKRAASALGYERYTADWRELVADPKIDAIVIATPPDSHHAITLAASKANKAVFCEKPLALNLQQAQAMLEAVDDHNIVNMVGYNYSKTPASQLVYQMIQAGEIGEIIAFHGRHVEDYLHDPSLPGNWRTRIATASEAGALGDIGSHIIAAAKRLIGDIDELLCERRTVIPLRQGERVENDDSGEILLKFDQGATGSIQFSRIYAGKKMGYDFEIIGTKGSVAFDQEQLNEVHWYNAEAPKNRTGFKRILTGPEHPDYKAFCLGPGHGNGYNDMMTIQARDFLEGILNRRNDWSDYRFGYEVDQIVETALISSHERQWIKLPRS